MFLIEFVIFWLGLFDNRIETDDFIDTTFWDDLSKLLDASIKFKSESAEDKIKIRYLILNYIYDKGLIKLWLASAYTSFVASVSGGS